MPRKKQAEKTKKATSSVLKEVGRAVLSIKLHPVAVTDEGKEAAIGKISKIYRKSSDSVRQHILMLIYEDIGKASDLRALSTFDQYRANTPKAGAGAIKMKVYKDMFNYNTSFEGLAELILILGKLGGTEAAKLLTHLFSHFCSSETEICRMLRNATIEALGESDSPYALKALLRYAGHSDNEKLLAHLSSALVDWDDKLDKLKLSRQEKDLLRKELREVLTREELPSRQYG